MQPQLVEKTIEELWRLTTKPINVNFFCHAPPGPGAEREVLPDELARAKEFTKGRLRLELETTNGVAFWLTYQELLLGEIRTIEEELALIDAVTAVDVRRVAGELLAGPMQMAVIGPFTRDTAFRSSIGA